MTSPDALAIHMAAITKRYSGGVLANDDVHLRVRSGEVHAIVGENGAGKSTLIHILFGRIQPDAGRVRLFGEEVRIHRPGDAIRLGLGLVSQHSSLIPELTVLENLMLGHEPLRAGLLDLELARSQAAAVSEMLGITLDWRRPVRELTVARRQLAEITRALCYGARVLLLDEPTAMLSPAESETLFALLRQLAARGTTVVLVTHRLQDVMTHASGVTVLRGGRSVAEMRVAETTSDTLAATIVGAGMAAVGRSLSFSDQEPAPPAVRPVFGRAEMPLLEIAGVSVRSRRGPLAVQDVTLQVAPGEVVGVAGVDGSGQIELAEALIGRRPLAAGEIRLEGEPIGRRSISMRLRLGLRYMPEDRLQQGLISAMSAEENLLLGFQRQPSFGGGTLLANRVLRRRTEAAIGQFDIRGARPESPAGLLSGGNQQKLLLARALTSGLKVLIAMQPSRGLDFRATEAAYRHIRNATAKGACALFFSLDLDEILELSDRVAVLHGGRLAGVLHRGEATTLTVGALMLEGSRA